METFVVGDVQGCYDELCALLSAAKFDAQCHRLASVGDLINRGPKSAEVLALAEKLSAEMVLGNHEAALVDGRKSETLDRVRAQLGSSLERTVDWMRTWPLYRQHNDWILVHAGIPPGKRPETSSTEDLLTLRAVDGVPWFESWPGPETVIFGHWAQLGKIDRPLCKGLDTGCVYGGRLTGIWWPRKEWVSVPAQRQWYDPLTKRTNW